MMVAPEYYLFTGREGEVISQHITHVLIARSLKFVPAVAFHSHPNIEEVICHDGVKKIERNAFTGCPRLRRVIMSGVKEVERGAFQSCNALLYVECGKLEIIGHHAFGSCISLGIITLPSIKIVVENAFRNCKNLRIAMFGKHLESLGSSVFGHCLSLERITLPLKDGMIAFDNIFKQCEKLHHVDLVEELHETVAAFLLEEWKNDMKEVIDLINHTLATTPAGNVRNNDVGGKAREIRTWIRTVLQKYTHYKSEHHRHVNEAAAVLQRYLPNDIVAKNILPFVELPSGDAV